MIEDKSQFDPSMFKSLDEMRAAFPEEAEDFVETEDGNGFVKKTADENMTKWEAEAERVTRERNIAFKMFHIGIRKPMDLALTEAKKMAKEFPVAEIEADQLMESIMPGFEQALPHMQDAIENHRFDAVLSEDRSGRVPAELIQQTINKIYKIKGEQPATLIPIRSGHFVKKNHHRTAILEPLLDKIRSGQLSRGFLYITDQISEGGSFGFSLDCIVEALETAKKEDRVDENFLFGLVSFKNVGIDWASEESKYLKSVLINDTEPGKGFIFEATPKPSLRGTIPIEGYPAGSGSIGGGTPESDSREAQRTDPLRKFSRAYGVMTDAEEFGLDRALDKASTNLANFYLESLPQK